MAGDTLRIGICDDDKEDLWRIEEAVRTSINKINIPVTIESHLFGIGEDMYEANRQESFDLFFLDIEMPELDGFKLARKICSGNPQVCLIFVSAHDSFIFDSQEYMPFWFVRKGMLEKDMLLALQKYFEVTVSKRIHYRLKDGRGYRDLFLQDIMYIECQGHMLMLQKADGKVYKQYGSLKALEEKLSGHDFLRIHKSFLVNQKYIDEIGKREVRLLDGTVLEMGRDRRKALCESRLEYERKRHGYQ